METGGSGEAMKFLIDECLSVRLVRLANIAGYEAHHVVYRGWKGAEDWYLMDRVRENDFTFVTNNGIHFKPLFADEVIHAGLIIIVPNVGHTLQCQLFDVALEEIRAAGYLLNSVLEVDLGEGDEISLTRYLLPIDTV